MPAHIDRIATIESPHAVRARIQRFDTLTWQQKIAVVLGLTLAIALAVGLLILSFSLAIILLPVVVVVILIARWRFNRALAEAERQANAEEARRHGRIIEAEFEVVDDERRP